MKQGSGTVLYLLICEKQQLYKIKLQNDLDRISKEVDAIFADPEFQKSIKEMNDKWEKENSPTAIWRRNYMRAESLHRLMQQFYM